MKSMNRRYSELSRLPTVKERFEYLKLNGKIGDFTFNGHRWMNQGFYRSPKWKQARNLVIIRDNGNDLGVDGFPIGKKILVHHMNPVTLEQLENDEDILYDPEFLICVSEATHNAIHYGDQNLLPKLPVERRPGDTCPWKRLSLDQLNQISMLT